MVATKTKSRAPSVASTVVSTAPSTRTVSVANSIAPSVDGDDGRAGLSLTKSGVDNTNPIQHGRMGQAERAFSAASTFLSGIMAISASQFIGAPLKLVDPKFYNAYMAWTKESFAVLVTTITQFWSPTTVRVSGDESMQGQLYQMEDGTLKCNFPHRLVLMANHQLYTDWLYLWWVAYTNKMHGHIYIILKESLKQLPVFGWGAQFYNFIFLSRKWETDKYRFKSALNHLKRPKDPMWLLIFPEGTNLSAVTREKSAAWAQKSGIPDMKHQLLPRSTGLQFCLKEMKTTTNWLYDCTIAYEGVPHGKYGQDIFTLRSSFLEGRPPKSVNMFWRRFRLSEIPLDNEEAFGRWLNNRWREKDYILEYFYKYHEFPEEDATKALLAARGKRKPKHAKAIATEVKGGGWDEFLGIFGPITSAAGALSTLDMTEPLDFDTLLGHVAQQQQMNLLSLSQGKLAETSQHFVRNALKAAQQSKAIPQPVLNYIIKEPPKTQAQMKEALVVSGKKTGNTQIAERAQKASAVEKTMSPEAEEGVKTAVEATKRAKPLKENDNASTISGPTSAYRKAMPLANMNSAVTRPLTTAAVQTAASSIRKAAIQRAKAEQAKKAAQSNQAQTPKQTGQNGRTIVVAKTVTASPGKKQPSAASAANSKSKANPNTVFVAKKQTATKQPAAMKKPPTSKA